MRDSLLGARQGVEEPGGNYERQRQQQLSIYLLRQAQMEVEGKEHRKITPGHANA